MFEVIVGKLAKIEGGWAIKTLSDTYPLDTHSWGERLHISELGCLVSFLVDEAGGVLDESVAISGLKEPLNDESIDYVLFGRRS